MTARSRRVGRRLVVRDKSRVQHRLAPVQENRDGRHRVRGHDDLDLGRRDERGRGRQYSYLSVGPTWFPGLCLSRIGLRFKPADRLMLKLGPGPLTLSVQARTRSVMSPPEELVALRRPESGWRRVSTSLLGQRWIWSDEVQHRRLAVGARAPITYRAERRQYGIGLKRISLPAAPFVLDRAVPRYGLTASGQTRLIRISPHQPWLVGAYGLTNAFSTRRARTNDGVKNT